MKQSLKGQRFVRLVVLERVPSSGKNYKWLCICDCGKQISVYAFNLTSCTTKSCGCLRRENMTKHGMIKSREYKTWESMKTRCLNKNSKDYKNYGGRGIIICDRWIHSFANFFADMGDKPEGLTLERINNNLGYSPENCKWATMKEQQKNKRNTRYVSMFGHKMPQKTFWELLGSKLRYSNFFRNAKRWRKE